METLLAICMGIGLAAACGFRVFVPMLIISLGVASGHLQVAQGFAWIGSPATVIAFASATLLEIGAYYLPWLDNLLDSIASPAAVVAGTIAAAAFISVDSPLVDWTLAAILGGGAAGLVQTGTVAVRAASSTLTGGLGNPVISTGEAGASVSTSLLAIFLPPLAVVLLLAGGIYVTLRLLRRRRPQPMAGA